MDDAEYAERLIIPKDEDAFHDLPERRRDDIAQAAIEAFGRNDYKGASTDAIARSAGISKGLLFFYCKNKRQLYLRAIEYLYDKVVDSVVDDAFWEIDDFFELLEYTARRKMAVMRRFPQAMAFSIRAFYPEHRDVKDAMDRWTQQQIDSALERFFANVDLGRFRDGVDARLALRMVIWLADGWMHERQASREPVDVDAFMEEFLSWLEMLRLWAYRPECLAAATSGPAAAGHGPDGEREGEVRP